MQPISYATIYGRYRLDAVLQKKNQGTENLENKGMGGWVILSHRNRKVRERVVHSYGSKYGEVARCCEWGNELSLVKKCGEFLGELKNC
jgi:hypothetical protein